MNNGVLYRKVLTMTFVLCAAALLCRVTKGYFSVVMVVLGLYWAMTRQYGKAMSCYVFFFFLIILNPFILPRPPVMNWVARLGPLLIGMVLVLMAQRRSGPHRLPLGAIFIYLICAVFSSYTGWCPKVSYLKMANFIVFLLGFWIGTQNLIGYQKELEVVRVFILSLAVITVFGSLCTLPFPAIAYPLDLRMAKVFREEGMDAATAYFQFHGIGMALFAGITFHSQTLGPLMSFLFVLVLADALFIESKLTMLHLVLLGTMPALLFMTRSRSAFLAFVVGVTMILWQVVPKIRISPRLRTHMRNLAMGGGVLLVIGMGIAEVSNETISRWIRKTDDIQYDNRSWTEAVTASRIGLAEASMYEFYRKPMLGMGFQVNYESEYLYGDKEGLILSAPIEKGLLPLMVLGEGGVIGVLAFVVFLVSFYATCYRRKYMVTIAVFTTFLAANMGEATFFSPGGAGGIEWLLMAVGGFCIDMIVLTRNRVVVV